MTVKAKNSNPANNYSRKDENFIIIFGWMTDRLKLSGNELLVYALIFSFAKDGITEFHGSAGYIAKRFNMSRRTVISILKSLTNKGLIKKKITGRYCYYSVLSAQNLHTTCEEIAQVSVQNLHTTCEEIAQVSAQNLHTTCEEIAQVSVQNLHTTCEEIAHYSKDISKEDIKSGSGAETTTTFIINKCKLIGYSIDRKKAQEILGAGITPDWLSGSFTYLEYIAGIVQENYVDKPPEQKRKLFRKIIVAEDRIDAFPEWRKTKEAEAAAQEERRQKETTAQEWRRKLEELKKAGPQKCDNCEGPIPDPESDRGACPVCGFYFFLNEKTAKWEFEEPISLSFRKKTRPQKSDSA